MSSGVSAERRYRRLSFQGISRRIKFFETKFGKWWWWILINMKFSDVPYIGRFFAWLAGLPLDSYRGKRILARVKTYVSPKAQISCSNLQLSSKCFIDDFVTIYGYDGSVVLGKHVHLYRGTIIEVDKGGKVIIGDNVHVHPNCNFNGIVGDIRIGNSVMIAIGCGFTPYQHKLDDLSQPMSRQELTSKGDIIIEDDVWLGMGVKVMDGVHIGRGAVIGANAVVTKNIPPYSIAVGVPARVIGKREAGP